MANHEMQSETEEAKQRRVLPIDVHMLPCKITFLLHGGMIGSMSPYINLFFVSIGLTTSQAGVLTGLPFIVSALANPLWGLFSDYTGRRKLVLALLCLGSLLLVFPMPWIAMSFQPKPRNCTLLHHGNITGSKVYEINTTIYEGNSTVYETDSTVYETNTTECDTNSTTYEILLHSINGTGNETKYSGTSSPIKGNNTLLFHVLLTVCVLGAVFEKPTYAYLDTLVMSAVKTGKSKESYGVQRLFSSIGFSITAYLIGLAADNYHHTGMSNYTTAFYFFMFNLLAAMPTGCYLINRDDSENVSETRGNPPEMHNIPSNRENIGRIKNLCIMMKKIDVVFFFITAMIFGFAFMSRMYFLLIFVNDELPAQKARMSLVMVTAGLSAMATFPFTAKMIRFLGGPSQTMILSMSLNAVRYTTISCVTELWIIIAIEAAGGLCYALSWTAMMEHIKKIAPEQIKFTMFMLLQTVHINLPGFLSNIVCGKLYEKFGGRMLFRCVGVLCGIWAAVMIMYHGTKYLRKGRSRDANLSAEPCLVVQSVEKKSARRSWDTLGCDGDNLLGSHLTTHEIEMDAVNTCN